MMKRLGFGRALFAAVTVCCIGWGYFAQGQVPTGARAKDGMEDAAPITQRFGGAGHWHADNDLVGPHRSWRIHAFRREDGSIKAKLSVLGVPRFENVTVEGQIVEGDAFGLLLDDKGTEVASFNAKLSPDGFGGSFILGNGESGTWEYDARTKAALQESSDPPAPTE